MLLVSILACYFVAWFFTSAKFPLVAIPREAFVQRWATWDASDDPEFTVDPKISLNGKKTNVFMRSLAYLSECTWCTGFWVSAVYTAILAQMISVPLPVVNALATAAGVGITASLVSLIQSWERRE